MKPFVLPKYSPPLYESHDYQFDFSGFSPSDYESLQLGELNPVQYKINFYYEPSKVNYVTYLYNCISMSDTNYKCEDPPGTIITCLETFEIYHSEQLNKYGTMYKFKSSVRHIDYSLLYDDFCEAVCDVIAKTIKLPKWENWVEWNDVMDQIAMDNMSYHEVELPKDKLTKTKKVDPLRCCTDESIPVNTFTV